MKRMDSNQPMSGGTSQGGRGRWAERKLRKMALAAILSGLSASVLVPPAHGQACPEPAAADFKATLLVDALKNPVHLAVAPDGRVFIADMNTGEIRLYKPGATGTTVAGKVPTRFDNEDGLLGIAVSPQFATNGFLFAIFTTADVTNRAHVVYRYKVNGDAIDIAGGVEVLKIPRVAGGRYHAGGGMAWDGQGNLIIGTGDDTNPHGAPNDGFGAIYYKEAGKDAQKSSSNTNDLRGKIIRIKPVDQPVNGKYYTIPQGNLFPEGTAKTRPEIYAMGARNPFRVSAHPVTNWVFFGEVGPDANEPVANRGRQGHDELNAVTRAGNYGWPYCNGNNFAYNDVDYSGASGVPGAAFDCAKPVNNSINNTGLNELPPSQAPIIWYAGTNSTDWKEMGNGGETAMAGPVYLYDKDNPSKTKFPPQYDGRLMFWDWSRRVIKFITLDAAGKYKSMVNYPNANPGALLGSIISAEYGKDGSLYVLRYSKNGYGDQGSTGGLFRVDYTGTINEACAPVGIAKRHAEAWRHGVRGGVAGFTVFELPTHAQVIEVFDLAGKVVWSESRQGRAGALRIQVPTHLAQGVVRARYR